jgi:Fe-S-cluster-containing dehydrogenase component
MARAKPPAVLEPRPGDKNLAVADLERLALFAGLTRQPDWEDLPGTWLLRHYHLGETVCRQNEPGWTAFYILTADDRAKLSLGPPPAEADPERVMSVCVAHPSLRPPGFGDWLRSLWPFGPWKDRAATDLAVMGEGELFGEMSCLYRTPRSATVVAEQDCYAIEMLRNILDKMYSNQNRAFKQHVDALYRARVLELHIRRLPVFRDLDQETFETLRSRVQLEEKDPGDLIFDEHDPPECLYVIRSGFVRVLKHASALLGRAQVSDWNGFCRGLHKAGLEADAPQRKVWDLLPQNPVRDALGRGVRGANLTDDEQGQILLALNALLKKPRLCAEPALQTVVQTSGWQPEAQRLPAAVRKWDDYHQVTAFNRRLLEAVFPGVMPAHAQTAEPARTLSYRAGGDLIGEMGVFENAPRSATCVAYDHPATKFGRVELVRIDKVLFDQIKDRSVELHRNIQQVVEDRRRETQSQLQQPVWASSGAEMASERFNELGLIQGQKLMLIDLDRCTRCDQCVQACVDTHPDRRSRLFLDGPRLQVLEGTRVHNYLVPATCRQCKDPICLIGCPVGSIHKGSNGQIVIEDWCIGCQRCAKQCPYGAIQMHAVGVVPRGARGWRYRWVPAGLPSTSWTEPGFDDRPWLAGQPPFLQDWSFCEALGMPGGDPAGLLECLELHFRYELPLTEEALGQAKSFYLEVLSQSPALTVWVNGTEVIPTADGGQTLPQRVKQDEPNFEVLLAAADGNTSGPASVGDASLRRVLRRGPNVLAVQARLPPKRGDMILDLGLYQMAAPVVPAGFSEFTQELVMDRAVVCDMCSEQLGRRPACVNACPHDAAMRVVATEKFPLRSIQSVCRAEPQPARAAVE